MEFEIIETQRLYLRKLTPEIIADQLATLTVEEAMIFFGLNDEAEYVKYKSKSDGGYRTYQSSMVAFQLLQKETGRVMGTCGYHNWYPLHNRSELGYSLYKDDYKNQGYMTEALEQVIEYGFRNMKLHRIEALIADYNIPSKKLLEKNGFIYEGVLREHYYINDRQEDSILYSLLLHEYEKRQSTGK